MNEGDEWGSMDREFYIVLKPQPVYDSESSLKNVLLDSITFPYDSFLRTAVIIIMILFNYSYILIMLAKNLKRPPKKRTDKK